MLPILNLTVLASGPSGQRAAMVKAQCDYLLCSGSFTAIAELADAMTALIDGTLPKQPQHTWWLYGHPGGWQTVPMKPGSDEKS